MRTLLATALLILLTGCAGHVRVNPAVNAQPLRAGDEAECHVERRAIWLHWVDQQRQEAACFISRGYRTPVTFEYRTSVITSFLATVDVTATSEPVPATGDVLTALVACETKLMAKTVQAAYRTHVVDGVLVLHGLPSLGIGHMIAQGAASVVLYRACMEPLGYRVAHHES
jgi:hypothetical protein